MPVLSIIQRIASHVRDKVIDHHPNPFGECISASHALGILYQKAGLDVQLVEGHVMVSNTEMYHWWVEVEDWLVDVTADQFDDDDNYFGDIVILIPSEATQWRQTKKFQDVEFSLSCICGQDANNARRYSRGFSKKKLRKHNSEVA